MGGGVCYHIHHEKGCFCLKKYKLYENGMDRLGKIINYANFKDCSCNTKVNWASIASFWTINGAQLIFDFEDNLFVNILKGGLLAIMTSQAFCGINDMKNVVSSRKKIKEIVKRLNDFNIDVTKEDLLHAFLIKEQVGDDVKITSLLLNERIITRIDDVETAFMDKDNFIDITDIINDATLTKRQRKKYNNSKQNR